MMRYVLFLLLCGLLACDGQEHPAEQDMRAAKTAWQNGEYAQAFALLEIVALVYGDSTHAHRALALREEYLMHYRALAEPLAQMPLNGCGVAAMFYNDLMMESQGGLDGFPDDLHGLYAYQKAPVLGAQCHYEKALFNSGFFLDCRAANILAREQGIQKDWLREKSMFITSEQCSDEQILLDENGVPVIAHPPPLPALPKGLAAFPEAGETVGDRFLPQKIAPEEGYLAIYYDQQAPGKIVFHDVVPHIGIQFSHNETFHDLPGRHFAAYWLGHIDIAESGDFRLLPTGSDKVQRVMIDGHVVMDDMRRPESLFLPQGRHLLEVEFASRKNPHVSFHFALEAVQASPSLKQALAPWRDKADIYYASVYGGDRYTVQTVQVAPQEKPVVLVLESYHPVQWRVKGDNIAAIFFASATGGGAVRHDHDKKAIIVRHHDGWFKYYDPQSFCSCHQGQWQCREKWTIATFRQDFSHIAGSAVQGSATGRAAHDAVLEVPQLRFDHLPDDAPGQEKRWQNERLRCQARNHSEDIGIIRR